MNEWCFTARRQLRSYWRSYILDDEGENRPATFDMMIDFVEHQHPQPKISLLMFLSLNLVLIINVYLHHG